MIDKAWFDPELGAGIFRLELGCGICHEIRWNGKRRKQSTLRPRSCGQLRGVDFSIAEL